MSLEESSNTLPDIIKNLAQQLYSRDAQLERERGRYVEELSVFKEQCDTMRKERDNSEVQRSRLVDQLTQEKAHFQDLKAIHDLEKVELQKKVDLLQQAASRISAIHQAEVLARSQQEVAAWKRKWEEWSSQFSQMSRKVNELTEVLRDSISSPTAVDSPLCPHQPAPISPDTIKQVSTPTSVAHRRTRSVYPNNTCVASELSIHKNSLSRAQLPEVPKVGVPNRVIHTAYFEIKHESDEDGPFSESYSSEALSTRVDDNESESPSAKRKRSSTRKQRHTEDDERQEEDADEALHQTGSRKRPRQNNMQDDHDEIAIGVEDNHKEVYGYKRVHVREVNLGRVPQRHGGRSIRH